MNIKDTSKSIGNIKYTIEYKDGKIEENSFSNAVLRTGREALAKALANEIGDSYDFFVSRMLFGDGGTNEDGVPKFVQSERTGLFGVTRANKGVIAVIDPDLESQVVFTCVLPFVSEANGFTLNEMALQMNNGDLYSMATFSNLTKDSSMQITWHWTISYI